MEKLLGLLTEYLHAAQDTLVKYSPQVWEATLYLIRMDSIFNLLLRLFWSSILVGSGVYLWKSALGEKDGEEVFLRKALCCGLLFVSFVIWATSYGDWLGAVFPKLYILRQLALKAGIM